MSSWIFLFQNRIMNLKGLNISNPLQIVIDPFWFFRKIITKVGTFSNLWWYDWILWAAGLVSRGAWWSVQQWSVPLRPCWCCSLIALLGHFLLLTDGFLLLLGKWDVVVMRKEWSRQKLFEKPLCWCWNVKGEWLPFCVWLPPPLANEKLARVEWWNKIWLFELALALWQWLPGLVLGPICYFWVQLSCLCPIPPVLLCSSWWAFP